MPIYEYRCLECESHVEKMQKISDPPLSVCEKCGGKLEKQWSLSGFQFKGAGWYVTDYANKGKPDLKAGAKSEESKAAAAAKPDAKTETPNNSEKSSAGESTAKTDTASNTTKNDSSTSKKE